jgi:predicted nucleotidyltransferase
MRNRQVAARAEGGGEVSSMAERNDRSDERSHSAERKQLLEQELARCLQLLTEQNLPERVILFGTLAAGSVHAWSDIDLVIVERTHLPFFQRIKRIRKLLQPKVGMDILVYTPEEFHRLCEERPFFKDVVVARGQVLYEHGR